MMVSTAIEVLPVPRSPTISSRCPRPRANSASIVRIPVCTGWVTRSRSTIDGAAPRSDRSSRPRVADHHPADAPADPRPPKKIGPDRRSDHRASASHQSRASIASALSSTTQPRDPAPVSARSPAVRVRSAAPHQAERREVPRSWRCRRQWSGRARIPRWPARAAPALIRPSACSSHAEMFVIQAQLLGDAVQIRTPVVMPSRVGTAQFDTRDQ